MPAPQITTKVPVHAVVGDQITDEATLTGPYQEGDQIDFWFQTGAFTNPDAIADELVCAKPHPDDTAGATHIGVVTLEHDIPAGTIRIIQSPQFTTVKPGCTFIKEIATRAEGDTDEKPTVLAQGWFGAADETTRWTAPAQASDTVLPNTGARVRSWATLAGALLIMSGSIVTIAHLVLRPRHKVK